MTRSHTLIGLGCLAVFSVCPGHALAQQEIPQREGGPKLTFGVTATVSADDHGLRSSAGESTAMFDMGLSFSYLDRRAHDALIFALDGGGIEPTDTSGHIIGNQRALVAYDRASLNSALSLGAEYNFASVEEFDPFDDEGFFEDDQLDESDLTQDEGNRQQIAARFSYTTGLNDPLELMLEGRYKEQTYQDTTNPDLVDTETFGLTGTTRLRLNRVTEARLVLRYEDYQAENAAQTHRQTGSVNLGLIKALSSIDSLDASLGLQSIHTEETTLGTRQTEDKSSLIGRLNFTRELPRGSISTSLNLTESVNGRTTTWLVNRELLMPRGQIDISFGVASDVDGAIHPVGSVNFLHKMEGSALSASFSRDVSTSTQSNELLTTQASLGYKYEINSLSDLNLSLNYVALDQAGGSTASDVARTDLRAAYARDLTRDWQISSGYEYRMRKEAGVGTAASNRVFITLQREFTAYP